MKNQITLLFLLFSISIFGQTELHLDWERVTDIPGKALAITMSGDTIYAYTKTSVFYSLDMGDNWELICSNNDSEREILANSSSNVIDKIIDLSNKNDSWLPGIGSISQTYTVSNSNGCKTKKLEAKSHFNYFFTGSHGGHGHSLKYNNHLSKFKILNNGTIIYHKETRTRKTYFPKGGYKTDQNHGTEFFVYKTNGTRKEKEIAHFNKVATTPEKPILDSSVFIKNYKYIPFIIGQSDNKFIAIDDSFYVEMTSDLKITKKQLRPEANFSYYKFFRAAYTENPTKEVFLLTPDYKLYSSKDRGENWTERQLDFDGRLNSYEIKNDFHIIKTSTDIYYSNDGKDFTKFSLFENDPFGPENIFVFNNIILAPSKKAYYMYRSINKGQTWEQIVPKGIIADEISNVFQIDDTLYVQSNESVFQQKKDNSFIYLDRKMFRSYRQLKYLLPALNYKKIAKKYNDFFVLDNRTIFQYQEGIKNGEYSIGPGKITKYNKQKYKWELFKDTIKAYTKINQQNNKIFYYSDKALHIVDALGNQLDSSQTLPIISSNLLITGDTIVVNNLSQKKQSTFEYAQYFSIDGGHNWEEINSENIEIGNNSHQIIKNGKLYYINKKVWIHNDFEKSPTLINDIPIDSAMVNRNADLLALKKRSSSHTEIVLTPRGDIFQYQIPFLNEYFENSIAWIAGSINYTGSYSESAIIDKTLYASSRTNGLWKTPYNYCKNQKTFASAPCDDGNPNSTNDKINENCECAGIIVGTNTIQPVSYFKINPNPNNGLFNLEIRFKKATHSELNIYSPLGKLVYSQEFDAKIIQKQIDLSDLSSGLYFMEINTEFGNVVRKVIIE